MTDTDALIELLGKATPDWWFRFHAQMPSGVAMYWLANNVSCGSANKSDAELAALAPDLAREVIALRAEIARLFEPVESDASLNLQGVVADLEGQSNPNDGGVCVRTVKRVINQLEGLHAALTRTNADLTREVEEHRKRADFWQMHAALNAPTTSDKDGL